MNPEWQSIVSAGLGVVFLAAIAKFFLQRSAERLDQIPEKLSDIKIQIASISAQLSSLNDLKTLVMEHDRQISRLSAGRPKYDNGCATKIDS